jgi:hypothetical protein
MRRAYAIVCLFKGHDWRSYKIAWRCVRCNKFIAR